MTPLVSPRCRRATCIFALGLIASAEQVDAQSSPFPMHRTKVRVVDANPVNTEVEQDAEPHVAVNPFNGAQVAVTATGTNGKTYCPTDRVPMFVTTDTGYTWAVNCNLPTNTATGGGVGDITVAFAPGTATRGPMLYAAIIRRWDVAHCPSLACGWLWVNVLRTAAYTAPALMGLTLDVEHKDQPFAAATTANGTDRVWVGNNEDVSFQNQAKTATVDLSLDAAAANAPWSQAHIERRPPVDAADESSIRTAFHSDGTVYAAFFGTGARAFGTTTWRGDLVVVRDDQWGGGTSPFGALSDPLDATAGIRVKRNVQMQDGWAAALFGQNRRAPNLTIAVDPRSSSTVFLAWGEDGTLLAPTIRVRRSADRGATWSGDLRVIPNAVNPSLAVNANGVVALLYQQVATAAGISRWETHLLTSDDNFASVSNDVLATVPVGLPAVKFQPYLGDYDHLLAVDKKFFGTFSAGNTPDINNFPRGVSYARAADLTRGVLLDRFTIRGGRSFPVPASIDPFFFVAERSGRQAVCEVLGICDLVGMRPGIVGLECPPAGCVRFDPIDRNCLVKFTCPGCPPGGRCWYQLRFEGLPDEWDVTLVDREGQPYAHEIVRSRERVVLSFEPVGEGVAERGPRDYTVVFQRNGTSGPVNARYDVRASITASDRPFSEPR